MGKKTMGIGNKYQGSFLLILCSTSIVTSAPGGNPECQADGSREPPCGAAWGYFSHESDCGKYWECGADLKPCLFDCPAISEDAGGGTLLFNSVKSACDWPSNVDCHTGGCCAALNVVGEKFAAGSIGYSHNSIMEDQSTDTQRLMIASFLEGIGR